MENERLTPKTKPCSETVQSDFGPDVYPCRHRAMFTVYIPQDKIRDLDLREVCGIHKNLLKKQGFKVLQTDWVRALEEKGIKV